MSITRPSRIVVRSLVAAGLVVVATVVVGVGSRSAARAANSADLLDVVRIGTGTGALSNAATPVFVVPLLGVGPGHGTTGTPIALPTSAGDGNNPFGLSGSAGSEGALELSTDGQYLTLAGYDATPGTTGPGGGSIANSSTLVAPIVPREAARVDGAGNVDTATLINACSTNNPRGAVSDDGTRFWVACAGQSGGNPRGIVYTPLHNPFATPVVAVASGNTNARVPVISGGQLYLSTNNNTPPGLYKVGSGLPTTPQAVTPLVAQTGSDPYSFVFTDANTLYVADLPGIKKYFFNGSAWVAEGSAAAPSQLAGLTGKVENGAVQLYATDLNGTSVYAFTDGAGSSSPISGSFSVLASAPANTVYKGIAFAPTGQVAPAPASTISLSDTALEGVISDPSNPTLTATVNNDTVSADQIQLTATSSNQAVAADGGITVSGAGATRTIAVQPAGTIGYSTITLTASAPNAPNTTTTFLYGASAPAPDATSHFLGGASDASTAIDVGDGYVVVGDDESNVLRLYNTASSGGPVRTWDFTSTIGSKSVDIEAAARWGDTIYWTGSMGNSSSDGSAKPERSTLFATQVTGSGAGTSLTFAGQPYKGLHDDLIGWDNANGGVLGLEASAQDGHFPKTIDGFNVEGLEFAADGAAYLGFRAPLEPTANRTQALVIPVTNLRSLVTSGGPATFGAPMSWNLGGLGVRELRRNANGQYLVIAGPFQETGTEFLYDWDGNPAHQPAKLQTTLPPYLTGAWEGIPSAPSPLADGAPVQLLMDTGDQDYYNDGSLAKDLSLGLRKALLDTFTIALPTPPTATISVPAQGAVYVQGQAVPASYSCAPGSGAPLASCVGTVASGASIDTSNGPHSFTVTATDTAGQTASATVTYTAAAQLGSAKTTCNGWFMGSGKDVIVPVGAVCHLLPGSHVTHDLTVEKGGTLDARGITVDHDLSAEGAAVTVCGSGVSHDLTVQNGAAGSILVGDVAGGCSAGNTIGHDLTVQNNAGAVDVGNNTVAHDVRVQNNKPGGAIVNANRAGHEAVCQGNSPQAGSGNAAIHSNTCP